MSYLIFARKYRPQTFDEVVGQQSVVQTLKNAIRTGRVTQAYLFSGMRGTGKTSVARILAKALNCANGPTPEPCRINPDKEKDTSCEFCRAIHYDRAIDVLEIDGASNRGIDEIRALREALKYKAIHSRTKVVIIDEVHQITKDGFNALLKTLEEPPPNTIFVFATTEFHKVPQTIVSRCQHFEFKKISHKDIINHLMEISKKESITITPLGLTMIAEAADGSLRDAQSLLDQAVAFSGENIQDEDLKIILGTIGQDILFRFSSAILEERPEDVFPLVESVIAGGHDLRFFYAKLVEHFRALLLVRTVDNAGDFLLATEEELKALRDQAGKASPEDFLRYLMALQRAEQGWRHAAQPRIYLEALLVRLCHFKKLVPLESVLKEFGEGKPPGSSSGPQTIGSSSRRFRESGQGAAESGTARSTAPEPPALDKTDPVAAKSQGPPPKEPSPSPKELFTRIIESLRRDKAALAAVLAQYSSVRIKGSLVEVFFENGKGFFADTVQRDIGSVEKAASEILGTRATVRLTEEIVAPADPKGSAREMEAALKDPSVRHFVDAFRAQVLSVDPVKRVPQERNRQRRGPEEGQQ